MTIHKFYFFQANRKSETRDMFCAGFPMKKVRKCRSMSDEQACWHLVHSHQHQFVSTL